MAQQRHQTKDKFVKLNNDCKRLINNCLALDWSPEQICGWLNVNNIVRPHHATIYSYLLKDKASDSAWYKYLRHQDKSCQKCYAYPNNRTDIPNRVNIDQHPEAKESLLIHPPFLSV